MNEELPINPSDVCYRAFTLMRSQQFDDAEKLLNNNLNLTQDKTASALYHSSLGVLFKMKGDYKTAWKHYERAEKLIPNDPALKIIVARLLIEHFSQYDQAISRAKKVLKLIPNNPVFVHQAFTTLGLAYLRKGKKDLTLDCLERSIVEDFSGFISAKNIDFNLVEAVLRKKWDQGICRRFFETALAFARQKKEQNFVQLFQKMSDTFEKEFAKR